ncbi:MAG TPA: ATPase domain-containing protein [Pyrinomonadaceae bacterium]|jgi:circadian clock protein KaiC
MSNENSPAQENGEVFPGQKKISVGNDGLDNVLEGGLPENHIYLVEGEPGTGKTTLALQFLLEGARRGESVLYVTLSETKNELINVAYSHHWSLEGLTIYELIPTDESLKPESQYTIFHPSEIELNETTSAILREVERINPKRVVFDSLSEMRLLARDPLRYRRQILALKQYFAPRDCTVMLLDDKTSDVNDLQVHSIVHGVLKLEHLAVEYSAERRRLRVSKLRGTRFRGGYHDFNIETGGLSVFPRLVSADHQPNAQKETVTTGVRELDKLLGGGLVRGTSTLIIGPAGSGKSSLATHFIAAVAGRGEKSAIFIFDEIEETFVDRAKNIGTPIDQFIVDGLIKMQQIDPAALSPGEFAHLILKAVKQDDVKFVVIDSLNGYLDSMPEERFLTLQMHELLTFLNQQGIITVLIMGQHGFLGSQMKTPVDVSYLADSVLLLRYFESHGAVRRAVSVVKKRTGSHENTIREMDISSEGIRVGKTLNEFQGVLTGSPVYTGRNRQISDFDAEE